MPRRPPLYPTPRTDPHWQEAEVNTRRPGRDELDSLDTREPETLALAAGTLRGADARTGETLRPHGGHPPAPHPEERISVFWRVFGGTLLSIGALIGITIYNNLQSNINELRAELSRSNEARAELVKKEEFNARTQNVWDRLQALQELKATVSALKEQVTGYGEKQADVKSVRDQLAAVEARLKTAEDDHKALARAELTLSTLEQKTTSRDVQLKAAEDERKEMAKQLAELRERLAKVEGATEVKPMPKPAPKGE